MREYQTGDSLALRLTSSRSRCTHARIRSRASEIRMDTTAAAAAAALQVSASPGTSEAISAARHPQTVETQLNFKMICTNGTHTYTHTREKESERDGTPKHIHRLSA